MKIYCSADLQYHMQLENKLKTIKVRRMKFIFSDNLNNIKIIMNGKNKHFENILFKICIVTFGSLCLTFYTTMIFKAQRMQLSIEQNNNLF